MATLAKGYVFGATETVTNAKLHALVDSGTVTNIVNDDIDSSAAIADSKLAQIATAGKVSGTAITALGHPLGCTGTKLTVQLLDEMKLWIS